MNRPFSYKRLVLAYAAFELLWIGLHTIALRGFMLSWQLALTDSLVNNFILGLAGVLISVTLKWYQPGRSNMPVLMVWIPTLAFGCAWLTKVFLSMLFPDDVAYLSLLEKADLIRFSIALLLITCVALVRWIYNSVLQKQEGEERKISAEKLLREAELTGLRQQLQPHFLFNSLNSISALAGSEPEESRRMIQQLSEFLRGTLKKDDQQMRPLKDELTHLQLYLDIEKVRFGHRLKTEIHCDEKAAALLLPPLLLQPIMENAIKFGLYDTIGEITIKLIAKAEGNDLKIEISNPFDQQTAQPRQGTGFGLSSVQRRLYLLFSRNDLLHVKSADNLFTTTVKIPQLS
ncbi:MAG: sensor histidine kinase [Bacteroidia bacterium]